MCKFLYKKNKLLVLLFLNNIFLAKKEPAGRNNIL